jgi:hypothetical protein
MKNRTMFVWLAGALLGLVSGALCLADVSASAQDAERVRKELEAWVAGLPARWPSGAMAGRSGTIVLRLSGDGGGVWHVRLAEGEVTTAAGEIPNPTAVIESSAADWLAVARGELPLVAAFFSGKMRPSGDLDFAREFYSTLLPSAAPPTQVTTDTTGWYKFEPLPIDYSVRGLAPDASNLLDPPAGRHGFLTVRGDRFVFQDGTPARFWGANIVSGRIFPDHERARGTAARLARFGCNMVRFHGIDANGCIFDDSYDDTQHFSADKLDRLDYLIYELKRHGIYINLGLLVFRNFRAGDRVRDWKQIANELIGGGKIAAHFNRRIIELQKKYAAELYTHVNKYTGLRYCDDPAIAMSEIINESSLFWSEGYDKLPPSYITELNQRFREWARAKGIAAAAGTSVPAGLRQRDPQVLQFLYDTQVAYFTEMRDYLRSVGVKVPLAGSNYWEAIAFDLKSNLALDYLDRHGYWDHPQSGFGPGAGVDNQPMVKSKSWNLVTWLAGQRAAAKPLVISEWNCAWINEYIAEGPLTMAAYGAFQGWDGLLTYCYFSRGDWTDEITDNFDVGSWPHVFCTWPAAARIFLRAHVQPGRSLVKFKPRLDQPGQITEVLPDRAGERYRLGFTLGAPGEPGAGPTLPQLTGTALSDTKQLAWDEDSGLITVNAPACAARIGFATAAVHAGPVVFEVTPEFAVVAVTALDDKPIAESKRLLITATARAENSGMIYGPGKKKATDPGHPPILMEPVPGRVRIRLPQPLPAVAAYALDSTGRRQVALEIGRQGNSVTIPLAANTFWYEVVISR